MSKYKIDDIRAELLPEGWGVESETYVNLDTQMNFICPAGHTVITSWKKLRAKRECPFCGNQEKKFSDNVQIKSKKGVSKRVLALDQATHTTGYAILDDGELVYAGTFETRPSDDEIVRMLEIKNWLLNMMNNWDFDVVGLEGIQYQANVGMGVTVFQTLARLQGILMATLKEQQIPYKICPTNTWRHHCGVKGKTRTDKKTSMKNLIQQWYGKAVSDDVADAIGIGKYVNDTFTKQSEITIWE